MAIETLTFETDCPWNTTVYDNDDAVLYVVRTYAGGDHNFTYVRDRNGDIAATLEWRDVLSDKVTLGDRPAVSMNSWMRKSYWPFVNTVTFKDDMGRGYVWQNNTPGLSSQLCTEEDKKNPIARFLPERRSPDPAAQWMACLVLTGRALEIRETVVISFLFLEKMRRMKEKSQANPLFMSVGSASR